jgi:hypothetical protein
MCWVGPVPFSDAVPSCSPFTHEQSAPEATAARGEGNTDGAEDASQLEALGAPAVHVCLNDVLMCEDAWDCAHVWGSASSARMLTRSSRLTEFAFERRIPAPSKTDLSGWNFLPLELARV